MGFFWKVVNQICPNVLDHNIAKSLIYATQQQDGEGYLVLIGKGKLEAGTKRIQSAKTHTPLGQIIGILLIRPGSNVSERERRRS